MSLKTESKDQHAQRIIISTEKIIVPADFSDPYLDVFFSVPENVKKAGGALFA